MDARILGREVAASRLDGARDRLDRPGASPLQRRPARSARAFTSSQCPLGPVARRSTSLPPIVLIAISIRPSLSASAAARPRPFSASPPGPRILSASPYSSPLPVGARTRTCSASVFRFVTGIAPAVSTRSGVPEFATSTQDAPQPAKLVSERRIEARPRVREPARELAIGRGRLVPRVRDEQARAAVRLDSGRDAHARERIGDALARRDLLEAEAEAGRVGRRTARPRHVLVELVRVLVVRDVEVGPAVMVVVEERRRRARG